MQQRGYTQTRSLIARNIINNDKLDEVYERKERLSLIQICLLTHVSEAMEQYKSMNIQIWLHCAYMKCVEDFVGHI